MPLEKPMIKWHVQLVWDIRDDRRLKELHVKEIQMRLYFQKHESKDHHMILALAD